MTQTLFNRLRRAQDGITGLETAIILIAFVVVASVFAYTVLSAGIFSAEKGKEAIHSGLEQARSSMSVVGSIYATGVEADTFDNSDDAWVASANVTGTTDTADKKEGTASVDLTIDALFATGLVAYEDITSANVSDHYSARLWIKSDTALAANVLQLVIDDTAGCGSPLETLNISALTANTWTQVQLKLSDGSALTAVQCVGLNAASDPGAIVVNVDQVEAPGELSQVHVTLGNTLDGEPINLTTTTDADGDGIISDEATKSHFLSIDFVDSGQRVADVTWTKTTVGKGDGDDLLEPDEKMTVTINVEALDPMPSSNDEFTLLFRPANGSTLAIERSLPVTIDTSMDLN